MKTHKAIAKRFRITKTGKIQKRTAGQGHYNSREAGKVTRRKRQDVMLSHSMREHITTKLPYQN